MKRLKLILVSTLLLFSFAASATAAEPINTLEKKLFGWKPSGVAIRGYDTVAYFTDGKPVKGEEQYSTEWTGAKWLFASQEHLDLFNADPEQYAPQYGGYCAYGVAQDNLVKIEPDLWTIVDGKLYLNYDEKFNNEWKKDIPGYIKTADAEFPKLLEEK